MKPCVSIIVPVYQAEATLERCLRSVINQTMQEIEVILIDDGSIDKSGSICDDYLRKDRRISVIHQKNAGVSVARNIGIESSCGKYLLFVDSDDYIAENYCKDLFDLAERTDADLVIAAYTRVTGKKMKEVKIPDQIKIEHIQDVAKHFEDLYTLLLLSSPWNKLYRRDMIKRKFPEKISMGEDFIFNMNYFAHIQKVVPFHKTGYYYVDENMNSLTTTYRGGTVDQMIAYAKSPKSFLDKWLSSEEVNQICDLLLFKCLCKSANKAALRKIKSTTEIKKYLLIPEMKQMLIKLDVRKLAMEERFVYVMLRNKCTFAFVIIARFRYKLRNKVR